MEQVEPTIADEPAAPEPPSGEPEAEPAAPAEPAPQPKPRGRPVGAKDRQPRTRRPTIRIEPLPEPEQPPPQKTRQPRAVAAERQLPDPRPPPEPVEEPPSPGTLYRETSQRLVHLQSLLNDNRRAAVADKYTSKLSLWTS
jgi:fused signal recognition particle receptor